MGHSARWGGTSAARTGRKYAFKLSNPGTGSDATPVSAEHQWGDSPRNSKQTERGAVRACPRHARDGQLENRCPRGGRRRGAAPARIRRARLRNRAPYSEPNCVIELAPAGGAGRPGRVVSSGVSGMSGGHTASCDPRSWPRIFRSRLLPSRDVGQNHNPGSRLHSSLDTPTGIYGCGLGETLARVTPVSAKHQVRYSDRNREQIPDRPAGVRYVSSVSIRKSCGRVAGAYYSSR
jgi:hypothetical protein